MAENESRRIARDLLMLSALTRRMLEAGSSEAEGELTPTQFVVLKWLEVGGPRRGADVAKFLSASAPAASQVLARLRRKRLISGRRSRDDARAEDLHVTERGRALVAAHDELRDRRMEAVLSGVPAAERRTLAAALERVLDLLVDSGAPSVDLCLHCDALASPSCAMRRRGRRCPVTV
jgi:DNA-binding MarR family transcriptional regulator